MSEKLIQRRPVDVTTGRFSSETPELIQRILLARGIHSEAALEHGLSALSAPKAMRGLDAAVAILADAVTAGRRLLVVGDFDADGATSSALTVLALRSMGAASIEFLVPNRFEYGYGLTPEIVQVAADYTPDVLITVDNGIASIDGVAAAKARGWQVVVTDHHLAGAQLPDADAVVNPNQPGCGFPSKNLAGVGVIFYVLSCLRTELLQRGWFEEQRFPVPNMAEYLDIVALGTVADVVPLDRNNRVLVHQGLERIRAGRCRPGISALLQVAGKEQRRVASSDIGFALGPRINAAGRLDDISTGIRCLMAEDWNEALELATELDSLNRDRKAIEAGMQREALAALEGIGLDGDLPWSLCVYDAEWHQGVVGILASRLKDRFHRPVIVFADGDNNLVKGSARSIPGLHIRDALDDVATSHPGLLSKFGGHAMAAGLSLPKENLEAFRNAFEQAVRGRLSSDDLRAVIDSDGELSPAEFNLELAWQLKYLAPWGQAFPEPVFDGEFELLQQRIVGERHLKMVLAPAGYPQRAIDAIAFNVDTELWPNNTAHRVRLAYKLDINEYRGRQSVQLLVDYLCPV